MTHRRSNQDKDNGWKLDFITFCKTCKVLSVLSDIKIQFHSLLKYIPNITSLRAHHSCYNACDALNPNTSSVIKKPTVCIIMHYNL